MLAMLAPQRIFHRGSVLKIYSRTQKQPLGARREEGDGCGRLAQQCVHGAGVVGAKVLAHRIGPRVVRT